MSNTRIEQVKVFKFRGALFDTEAKAVDHAEGLVAGALRPALLARGFTVSEWVKISEAVIANREKLLELLDYGRDV